jgi:biotin-dependent carboxylase-like uncharacterized protein
MIELLSSGFYTSIQDKGRFQYTHFGVPLSGAMDQNLSALANLLVGNTEQSAVIEMTFAGPKLKFNKACTIAVTAVKAKGTLNDKPLVFNRQVKIEKNDVLNIQQIETRAYLAIRGGLNSEMKLGSFSQYEGITQNFKLLKGDVIECKSLEIDFSTKHASINYNLSAYKDESIEVFCLPEYELLPKSLRARLKQNFEISSKSNRMAYQLEDKIENNLEGITSKPVMPGTVQLTPQGNLIILMRDAQVTGGYPRIFQLSENSINKLAQKPPNTPIGFKIINF